MYLLNTQWFASNGYQSFHFILESFYYFSGIALFILAIIQLISVMKNSKIKSQREAFTLSSQQCEKFYAELVPLINEIDKKLNEHNLTKLKTKISSEEDFFKQNPFFVKTLLIKDEDFSNQILYCTNLFESFSTYFTTGVADADTAFQIIGAPYCSCIISISPMIFLGTKAEEARYPSIRKLYLSWSKQLETQKLERNLSNLNSMKTDTFKSLGT